MIRNEKQKSLAQLSLLHYFNRAEAIILHKLNTILQTAAQLLQRTKPKLYTECNQYCAGLGLDSCRDNHNVDSDKVLGGKVFADTYSVRNKAIIPASEFPGTIKDVQHFENDDSSPEF